MDIVGKTIGRHEILEEIGEGGMAMVYKAYDPHINRSVALKILKEEHCLDEEHKRRFLKEGEAAGALAHPNIVTIYDVGSIEGAPYIMMELLEGRNLGDTLDEGEKLSTLKVVNIAMQLASALDYAHAKGVVHRDLKPDNIMLTTDNETIKIADFGVARMANALDKETTQVGMMLGTPRYMSPEQASGLPIDGCSDLFTVGVILYELITGQKAFDAESMPTLIMQIVKKDPIPIRQISSDTPVGLQKIINKLLQKKPEKRFQSGQDLYAALQRELLILKDTEEEQRGYVPLQIKWTAIMGAIVALTMALSSVIVFRAQSAALTQLAIDSGSSLSRFIAVQVAIPVLGEDWITLESLVQDASSRRTFQYLVVSDHAGVVRSATDESQVGSQWDTGKTGEVIHADNDVVVTSLEVDAGEVFNFSLPVLFNSTVVGAVNIGLDTRALQDALATTKRMMAFLAMATVLAVSLVVFIFNKLIARNLLRATSAIQLFGRGKLETRISQQLTDEFGDLFSAFNSMADELESKLEPDDDEEDELEHSKLESSAIIYGKVDDKTLVRGVDGEAEAEAEARKETPEDD